MSIFFSIYGIFPISSAKLGLSIIYSLSVVNYLNGLVNSVTESEQLMISVERIKEYLGLENEYQKESLDLHVPNESQDMNDNFEEISTKPLIINKNSYGNDYEIDELNSSI
jgi:hypothetical protein